MNETIITVLEEILTRLEPYKNDCDNQMLPDFQVEVAQIKIIIMLLKKQVA